MSTSVRYTRDEKMSGEPDEHLKFSDLTNTDRNGFSDWHIDEYIYHICIYVSSKALGYNAIWHKAKLLYK